MSRTHRPAARHPSGDRHGHDGAYLINEVLHAAGIRRIDTKASRRLSRICDTDNHAVAIVALYSRAHRRL